MRVEIDGKMVRFSQKDADLVLESLTVAGVDKNEIACPLCNKYDDCDKCPLGITKICDSDLVGDIEIARKHVVDGETGGVRRLRNVRRRVQRILARAVK